MPYVDNNLVLSDAQAVTATAASSKSVDFATALRNIGSGNEIELVVNVATACSSSTATTVTFAIQDSADNSSFADVVVSPAVSAASLTLGAEPFRTLLPRTLRRYVQVNYTVATGSLAAGAFTAYLTDERQDNVARPSGFTV